MLNVAGAEHRIGREFEIVNRRKQTEHGLDGRLAQVRVRRVRGAPAGADDDALRALGAAGELALGGFAVDQPLAGGGQMVGGARAVGVLLLAHHEQQIHPVLAFFGELLGRDHHGSGDALGVAGAATVEAVAFEPRRHVGRHGIEVRGQRDALTRPRCPDVRASGRDFLQFHVPTAGHEPAGNEVDGAGFGAAGRLDGQQFGGEGDDVGHPPNLSGWRRHGSYHPAAIPNSIWPSLYEWAPRARAPLS